MQTFKKVLLVLTVVGSLSSFTIIRKDVVPNVATPTAAAPETEKAAQLSKAINDAQADGKVTFGELKNIFEIAKGQKLSFKDKVVLRLFNKKLEKTIMAHTANDGGDGKSQLVALLLCFFLGGIGVHRFYLGYTWQGIVQILTLGGLGIWTLIDFIRIITGDLKPKDGDYGTTL
jgi:hypothetical protein